jgi:hypothetical protein
MDEESLSTLGGTDGIAPEYDIEAIHRYLTDTITKKKNDCAIEFFLRRRMEDCS